MRWPTRSTAHRGVHVRHAAHAADPGAAAEEPRAGAGRRADLVADWDGGTRIGDALAAFLAVPRFAGYARGALVLVLSDGLERGDPAQMIRAVGHLAARAWRIDWLTPLAAAADYRPETAALRAVLPMLDSVANGATTERLCRHVLDLSRRRAADDSSLRRAASMRIITSGGSRICPGCSGRCSRGSSGPTSRSAATTPSRNIWRMSPPPASRGRFTCRRTGRRSVSSMRSAMSATPRGKPAGRMPLSPMRISARRMCGRNWSNWRRSRWCGASGCSCTGTTIRNTASHPAPDLARDPTLRRNIARLSEYGWAFDLQVFAPQMAGAAELADGCPDVNFVLAARRHAGGFVIGRH